MTLPQENQRYTYADYYTWDDGERWELIEGEPYLMSPAPRQVHQEILRELLLQLATFLKGKPCKLFTAPFDVRLNADTYDDTVVQPDLLVVCDRSKLD
ncbi:MAG: Uma2 family endonuclease, partial [Acidobacteriota bacterium]|nr:Uma2 family endonuclease [Acidobacteriota bacterium]